MSDTYSLMREIADSWVLLALTLFFVGMVVYVFRPGSRAVHDDAANAIFRDHTDTAPRSGTGHAASESQRDRTTETSQ